MEPAQTIVQAVAFRKLFSDASAFKLSVSAFLF